MAFEIVIVQKEVQIYVESAIAVLSQPNAGHSFSVFNKYGHQWQDVQVIPNDAWLSVTPGAPIPCDIATNGGANFTIIADLTGKTFGTYIGSVKVSPQFSVVSQVDIPVILTIGRAKRRHEIE